MCGIVGYVGKEKALPYVLGSLKMLEYRGYDSAGVAYIEKKKIKIIKEIGKIINLEKEVNYDTDTYLAIGHTRWATHGKPSKENAHPHKHGKFVVVHNGIIENYMELRKNLENSGIKFKSETDTEVIPTLLDREYAKTNDVLQSIKNVTKIIKGAYALGILFEDDNKHLYALRKDSPLIIAKKDNASFLASDVPAILEYTNKYYLLNEGEIAVLSEDTIKVYDDELQEKKNIKYLTFEGNPSSVILNGYDHYMLKEINESKKVFLDTYNYYVDGNDFKNTMPKLKQYKNIHIVACGSASYVGLIGKCLIEKYADIPVMVECASEYRYKKNFYDKKTLVIIISQSGETADSLACLRKAANDKIDTLAIVNAVGSSIAREAKYTLYVKAGPEIAVATTKAFVAQVTLISLLAIKLSNNLTLLKNFKGVDKAIDTVLGYDYKKIAKDLYKNEKVFYIGRQIDYALCEEGSLKLKETSYINSNAYASGELKHGSISLIDEGTPVIGVCLDDEIRAKEVSNLKEVKARLAKVILLTNEDDNGDYFDEKIVIPKLSYLVNPIFSVIPMQLLAYNVAVLRGCSIDKPKNLAKSVTVE